ncbi:MAG: hypothetical protein ABEI52_05950, partial [Halobacteriaceae archaeon]
IEERPGEEEDAPMEDLARRVAERGDAPESGGEFEAVETAEIDTEDVWADLEAGTSDEPITTGERVEGAEAGDVRIIPKRTCHTCPYFGEPPDLHCNHEGTEIIEVVNSEEYKVSDCPMVIDAEDLEFS